MCLGHNTRRFAGIAANEPAYPRTNWICRPGKGLTPRIAGSGPEFIHDFARANCTIGVGAKNGYGHPTQETIEMLAGSGSTTIRSDQHGIALIWRDAEGTLRVWTEHRKSDTLN